MKFSRRSDPKSCKILMILENRRGHVVVNWKKNSTCQTPKYGVVLVDSWSVMYWARYGNSCTELGIDKYSRLAAVVLDMRFCLLTVFLTVFRLFTGMMNNPTKLCRRYKILAVLEISFNLTWTKFVENLEFIFEFVWFFFVLFLSTTATDLLELRTNTPD